MYSEQARLNLKTNEQLLVMIDKRMTQIENEMVQLHKRSRDYHNLNSQLTLLWAYKILLIEG